MLLLAHQPKQIAQAVTAGVDLQISGHTHGGQIWPFNFLVRLDQPVVHGLSQARRPHAAVHQPRHRVLGAAVPRVRAERDHPADVAIARLTGFSAAGIGKPRGGRGSTLAAETGRMRALKRNPTKGITMGEHNADQKKASRAQSKASRARSRKPSVP